MGATNGIQTAAGGPDLLTLAWGAVQLHL